MQVFKYILLFIFIGQAQSALFDDQQVYSLNDFSSIAIKDLLKKKSLVVVFSKDCAHCKPHFKSLKKCFQGDSAIIPISVDDDKRKVKRYWKSLGLSFPAWMGNKSFNKKFSSLKKGLPYSYFYYQNQFYPIGAGPISCDRIAQLSHLGSKA